METRFLIALLLLAWGNLYSQESFSFEEALKQPEKVKKILFDFQIETTKLPDYRISQLINLETIQIYRFKGDSLTLPKEISKLKHLKMVLINGERLKSLPPIIWKLKNIEFLAISTFKLKEVPPEIWNLTTLRTLVIRSRKIETLPVGIGMLKNLKKLSIHSESLRTLPKDIGKCTNLEQLDLYGESIELFPSSFKELQSLKQFRWGRGTYFPEELCSIASLKSITFDKNFIQSIPPCIQDLENLTTLELSFSEFEVLPKEIALIPNLKYVDFSWNIITSIPIEFSNMDSLIGVNLGYNQGLVNNVDGIIETFKNMKNLKWLNLQEIKFNKIQIEEIKQKLPSVKLQFIWWD